MKTIFRFLGLALVVAAGAGAGFGQNPAATPDPVCAEVDAQNALYTPFVEVAEKVRKKEPHTLGDVEKAVDQGKSFLEKYGACADLKAQADFVKGRVPRLEKRQTELILAAKYKRFNDAVNAKKWDDVFPAAKEVLAANPSDSHIVVALGLIGLDLTYQKNYKHSDQAIQNAKAAIALLKAGSIKPKDNGGIGAWYECKPAECSGDLTFAVAHMTYWGKSDKTGALPYYYETTQLPGLNKDNPAIYEAICRSYSEKAAPIAAEIKTLIDKQTAAKTDEEKLQIDGEIKPKVALLNGYSERTLDACGRAHKHTKDATRKGVLYKELQRVYELRFDKKEGLDTYISSTVAKSLPNPTSTVEPIVDPEPVKIETTTGTTTTAPAATAPAAKPAATTTTKPISTTRTKVSSAAATNAAPAETDARKPVAKKKGTH